MEWFGLAALEVILYIWFLIGGNLFVPDAEPGFIESTSFAMVLVVNVLAIVTVLLEKAGLHKLFGNIIYYGGIFLTYKLILSI